MNLTFKHQNLNVLGRMEARNAMHMSRATESCMGKPDCKVAHVRTPFSISLMKNCTKYQKRLNTVLIVQLTIKT